MKIIIYIKLAEITDSIKLAKVIVKENIEVVNERLFYLFNGLKF